MDLTAALADDAGKSQDLDAMRAADEGTALEPMNRPKHHGRGYKTGHAGGHGKGVYSQELADEICTALHSGKGLTTLCRENPHWPGDGPIRQWLADPKKADFAAAYVRARQIGYQAWSDQILEIADNSSADRDDDGKPVREIVERSKLRVETRKWLLSKLVPKTYGDKIDVTTRDETETIDVGRLNRLMLQALGVRDQRVVDGLLESMGLNEGRMVPALPAPAGSAVD